jgi:hypothetical protein
MTAGYSGKPLAAKLGIDVGERWLLVNAPKDFDALLSPLPEGAKLLRTSRGGVDGAVFFVKERGMLARSLGGVQEKVGEGGAVWVAWPKKASGVPTDVTEDTVREVALPTGWVDTKVCAIDATWSGLKLMRRVKPSDKPGRPTAAQVEAKRKR